jgi:hypothetical protein
MTGADPSTPAGVFRAWLPEPIITRQSIFAMPYHIQRPIDRCQDPAEVHLYVSADQGATWRLWSRVGPAEGQFVFRAPGDGEYWFVVRTMDRAGVLRPEGIQGPELRVVVDTTPPTLQLQARRGSDGQIIARWEINEFRLKPDSFVLQYRVGFDQPWETVAADPRNQRIDGTHVTGEVAWWPRAAAGILEIRAEVADAAGNPAVNHAQIDLFNGRAPATNTVNDRGSASAPRPVRPPIDVLGPWRPANDAASLVNQALGSPTPSPAAQPPTALPGPETKASLAVSSPGLSPSTQPIPSAQRIRPTVPVSMAMQFNPAVQDQYSPQPAQSEGTSVRGSGNAMRPKMIHSRTFQLEYDVSSLGPPGTNRVEVWGTRDGGQNWQVFAVDDNGHSPILVGVDGDGLYGFRVVVRSGNRIRGEPPKRGDVPDTWISVNLTKSDGSSPGVQREIEGQSDRPAASPLR